MTTGSTYKVVELVGTSSEGIDQAIEGAIARAGQTLNGLDWFEVKEIRGQIQVYDSGTWTVDDFATKHILFQEPDVGYNYIERILRC